MTNNSGYNLESLMVPALAATVYAAQESSLYLPGGIIPMETVPAGSTTLQVPVLAKASAAEKDSAGSAFANDDFTSTAITDTTVSIPISVYARRTILRDVGGVNPSTVGRQLGNAVAQTFDKDVTALFALFTANTAITGSGADSALTIDDMFDAAAELRSNEVMGPLYAILHPRQTVNIKKTLNTAAFANADAQNEAMRSGYVGYVAGIQIFESAFITETATTDKLWNGLVFGEDAMRIGVQKGVDLEAQRRAEAVGFDLVANLHAGVGIVDQTRGIVINSTGTVIET
jgi:hypothetical protein